MKLQLIKKLVALLCFAAVWVFSLLLPVQGRAAPVTSGSTRIVPTRGAMTSVANRVMVDTVFNLLEGQPFTWAVWAQDSLFPRWWVIHADASGNALFPQGATFPTGNPTERCIVAANDTLNMVIEWNPTPCDSGYYEIKWWAEVYDDCFKTGTPLTASFVYGYYVANVNRPPSIDSVVPDSQTKQVGTNVHVGVFARDRDQIQCGDDSIMFSYSSNPAPLINAALSPSGSFDWTPVMAEVGIHHLTFRATDRSDSFATKLSIVRVYGCADLNSDGQLTATDVVLELNAVFLGNDPPAPFNASDLNGDGVRTASDVVMELNAVFLGIGAHCP